MRIVKLEASNVLRLRAISITPEGDLIVIGGKNGQGKTSTLNAIEIALGGKRSIPSKPVREGEDSAYTVCDLGDLIVKRVFKADGSSTLTVESQDGARYRSPQAMLDKLVGDLTFDPLEFVRKDGKEQLEMLRALAGVDLAEFDRQREELYSERKSVNKEARDLEAKLRTMESFPDAPAEELSVAELVAEYETAQQEKRELDARREKIKTVTAAIEKLKVAIETKRAELGSMEDKLELAQSGLEASKQQLAETPEPAVEEIQERLRGAEETNQQVRANQDRENAETELESKRAKAKELTAAIELVDRDKVEAIQAANLPVKELSFNESGVLFNGMPFDQAGGAEQLRVSMAMGIALNPKLRVLLIRDGSLLDEDSLRAIAQMAAENDMQVWLERVGEGEEVSVVIEDGQVK